MQFARSMGYYKKEPERGRNRTCMTSHSTAPAPRPYDLMDLDIAPDLEKIFDGRFRSGIFHDAAGDGLCFAEFAP